MTGDMFKNFCIRALCTIDGSSICHNQFPLQGTLLKGPPKFFQPGCIVVTLIIIRVIKG